MRLPVPGPGELVRALHELTSALAGVAPGLSRALALLPRIEELLVRVDTVVSDIERTVDRTESAVRRVEELLAAYEEPVRELAPTVRRLAETMDPAEVEAAVALVDRLPRLLDAVDRDVLPMLTQLQAVGPDVHELLDIVDDVRRMLAGLPGVALLRRDG
ncbi:MAG: hypothetical protein ACR2JO_03540 [Mycobacteriales bacterium]